MSRRFSAIFILNIAALALAVSCGKNPVEPPADPVWLALTADFRPGLQIYLVDYNDPTRYKKVTTNDHSNSEPKFFPDHSQLIFLDRTSGFSHNPLLRVYDLESEEIDSLSSQSESFTFPVYGNLPIVFEGDGSGIYIRVRAFASDDMVHYNFSTQKRRLVLNSNGPSEYVIGLIGSDTLIAFTNDTAAVPGPSGYYYMDLEGNYLSQLNNPHLESMRNPDWNDTLKLFVVAEFNSRIPGFQIAVTDLSGAYFRAYTSGQYLDNYPSWGLGGKSIIFQRRELSDVTGPTKLMLIDVATGDVRVFLEPGTIDGAFALSYPSY